MENKFLDESDGIHHDENSSPIDGYQDQPIMTLEEAVQSITHVIPNVINYVTQAKLQFRKTSILTDDESAAIYLYTMGSPVFSTLNHYLRAMDIQALKPWFAYLKLFITALNKLPSSKGTVWRGVQNRINFTFAKYSVQTWWTITSTSKDLNTIKDFLGKTGTLYAIETINGKDISQYAAIPNEQEVILMPGTRIYLTSEPLQINNGPLMLSFKECTNIPQGKHVMFSHDVSDETIILQILQLLRNQSIPVWFDKDRRMSDNIYDSLAVGVENAACICCFVSPEYEKSARCRIELQYANKLNKKIIPCLIRAEENWKPVNWLKPMIQGVEYVDFRHLSNSSIPSKANSLIWKLQDLQYVPEDNSTRSNILFELIKYEYIRNSAIERFMNPSISFPIEQSYINLAIVETKEHQEKEKGLLDTQNIDTIMGTFEQIYGSKTPIDVKDIFKTCKDQARKVLVCGRAGIGKSTFCRYTAHQWATSAIWSEYELVVLIPLRSLTKQDYQVGINYYLIDILKTQYFSNLRLSVEDEKLLEEKIRTSHILWLLDGYDEIVQNDSAHIKRLTGQLLETPNHILTSRPYMNTLPYPVQMEITGFTDKNITNYVKLFFDQLENMSQNSSDQPGKLLSFLKLNPRIWGIAHIPINLELVCSVWSNTDWTQNETITMTVLYSKLTGWICRRYLEKQREIPTNQINLMGKNKVFQYCDNELAFLETLAFHGMESNTILLSPKLLETAEKESNCSLVDHPHLLNLGILKSSTQYGTTTRIEVDKDHYFVHLSFQEYFAARYLARALSTNTCDKAINFIRKHKYNLRFQLVFIFASGLLIERGEEQSINIFWDILLNEPIDLVGIRHMDLVICCFDEIECKATLIYSNRLIDMIIKWIELVLTIGPTHLQDSLAQIFRSCNTISNELAVQKTLIKLLSNQQSTNVQDVLFFLSSIPLTNPISSLLDILLLKIEHTNFRVRRSACLALGKMGEKAPRSEVINRLVSALGDEDPGVRRNACYALSKMDEKAATSDVINRLMSALDDENPGVRSSACYALGKMGEKAATSEVINRLVTAIGDENPGVRSGACFALCKMGEKAATSEVIRGFLNAISDEDRDVRYSACDALGKIGKKAATSEMINRLVSALGDEDLGVRRSACAALGKIGEKAATSEVINRLVSVLGHEDHFVRYSTCFALAKMGEQAATIEVINRLVTAIGDDDPGVRSRACFAFGTMGEKAATSEVIRGLLNAISDEDRDVRYSACDALGKMGEKAATNEVIIRLVSAVGDEDRDVRYSACHALGKMSEKAATNEMINRLVSAVGDEDFAVRNSACYALRKTGEEVATSEVINRLVSVLGDKYHGVRNGACYALGKMGEKAATSEVINELVTAIGDENPGVRSGACFALGKMGEKAATSEVIRGLLNAIGDEDRDVRYSACDAVGKMGEKAATSEVINRLVGALGDEDPGVRSNACYVLGKMGEKAATSEVINQMVSALKLEWFNFETFSWTNNVLNSLSVLSALAVFYDREVATTAAMVSCKRCIEMRLISLKRLLKVYMDTQKRIWLSGVVYAFLFNRAAATVFENTIWVYEREGVTQIPIGNQQLLVELQEGLSAAMGNVDLKIHNDYNLLRE